MTTKTIIDELVEKREGAAREDDEGDAPLVEAKIEGEVGRG